MATSVGLRRQAFVFAACALLHGGTVAQAPGGYDGTWKAEYTDRSGTPRSGKVVIAGKTGTWDIAVQQRNNPCVGLAYPLTVTTASETELGFKIERAATLAGCQDGSVSLKRIDANTLEGAFDNGNKVRLLRQ